MKSTIIRGFCGAHVGFIDKGLLGFDVLSIVDAERGESAGIMLTAINRCKLAAALLSGLSEEWRAPVGSAYAILRLHDSEHAVQAFLRDALGEATAVEPGQELWLLGRDAAGKIYGIKRLDASEPFDDGLHADVCARLEAEGSL